MEILEVHKHVCIRMFIGAFAKKKKIGDKLKIHYKSNCVLRCVDVVEY